ncbi:MAG: TadE/TadG family type IV pilus assembly protein [Acidimicrobiales bacterium]
MSRRGGAARGQATVEFALVLPLLLGLALFVVQLGLIVRDQIMVVNAAREGARQAAVAPSLETAQSAAQNSGALDPARMSVVMARDESTVTVTVTYRSVTAVPLIGPLLGDLTMSESTTMRLEAP